MILESGETHPNSWKKVDGPKRPLLVPSLWILIEFRQRREVCSGPFMVAITP